MQTQSTTTTTRAGGHGKRAFAVAAHPDDIELLMAGTLLLLGEAGYELHVMSLANGSCGTLAHDRQTIIRQRRAESQQAAQLAGAVYHESLVDDFQIFYDRDLLASLGSVMRAVAPDILLIHSPEDYMEDHMIACRLALTAAFARGMPNFTVQPHQPPVTQDVTVYHSQPHLNRNPLGRLVCPDLFVNIESVLDRKQAMLAAHKSQHAWLSDSQGLDLAGDMIARLAREVGAMSGRFEYAEGWRRHFHAGYCSEDADPLQAALAGKTGVKTG